MKLCMFRTVPLSIIRSFFHCTHSNGICHTGLLTECLRAGSGYSILILLEGSQQTCMTYKIVVCTVKKLLMMDRGTVRNM